MFQLPLVTADLPDEDEDDDEEYNPQLDPDRHRVSDDEESSMANSDAGTPSKSSQGRGAGFLSPLSSKTRVTRKSKVPCMEIQIL